MKLPKGIKLPKSSVKEEIENMDRLINKYDSINNKLEEVTKILFKK